jgi:hypothetical protein
MVSNIGSDPAGPREPQDALKNAAITLARRSFSDRQRHDATPFFEIKVCYGKSATAGGLLLLIERGNII